MANGCRNHCCFWNVPRSHTISLWFFYNESTLERKKKHIPKPNSHYWVHDFLAYPVWWDMTFLVSLEGMTLQSPRRITGADRRMPWHGDSPGWSHWDWSHEKCAVPWENRRFWGNVCIAWVGRCLNFEFSRRGLLRVLKGLLLACFFFNVFLIFFKEA